MTRDERMVLQMAVGGKISVGRMPSGIWPDARGVAEQMVGQGLLRGPFLVRDGERVVSVEFEVV